ncbi:MAG: ATP-dependent helicase [Propionibacteriaceae bacterium]|jgi:DNA helicase-2/ATP-dependent DNA helicase PcrA|nr:ATP-dependent helicase [Propionibacteriaceae bacterium]
MTAPDPQSLLDSLDDEQRAAASALGRPVAVIAGPGTGKTRVIVCRLAYGSAAGEIDPAATLAVTFTTRAAAELRSRLAGLAAGAVQARTFHSAALAQAQFFWPLVYGAALPRVADSSVRLFEEVLPRFGLGASPALARELAQAVAWTKQTNVVPEDYVRRAEEAGRSVAGLSGEQVADLLIEYERVKQDHGLIDLDDILLCAAAVLEDSEEASRLFARRYRHLVVDEFQDVSPIQSRLVELWRPRRDVCVVGDPAQTIHGFAGARSDYLTGFAAAHRGVLSVTLSNNYRSTPQIVAAANTVLRGHGGVALTARAPAGPPVSWSEEPDEATEAAGAAVWLAGLAAAGLPWSAMAVLYRSHAQAVAIAQALGQRSIPVRVLRPSDAEAAEEAGRAAVEAVTCCTLHAAKGREWDAVALVGVQEGTLPHGRALGVAALAEERRLLYVGLTRARRHLLVSWARWSGYGGRAGPSRFLVEAGLA